MEGGLDFQPGSEAQEKSSHLLRVPPCFASGQKTLKVSFSQLQGSEHLHIFTQVLVLLTGRYRSSSSGLRLFLTEVIWMPCVLCRKAANEGEIEESDTTASRKVNLTSQFREAVAISESASEARNEREHGDPPREDLGQLKGQSRKRNSS